MRKQCEVDAFSEGFVSAKQWQFIRFSHGTRAQPLNCKEWFNFEQRVAIRQLGCSDLPGQPVYFRVKNCNKLKLPSIHA